MKLEKKNTGKKLNEIYIYYCLYFVCDKLYSGKAVHLINLV